MNKRETYIHNLVSVSAGWQKHPASPVLGGDLGTCFDISMLQENGCYRMWFSWRPKKSLALTESLDGVHWSTPVIVLEPRETPQGWESDLNRPGVVWRANGYHMWYTGQRHGTQELDRDGGSYLFYATSPDGLHWQRASLEPVMVPEEPWEKVALMCPSVLWDEEEQVYKMWYSGGEQYEPNAFGYATSPDGLHWTKHPTNPIFIADQTHPWEQHKVGGCQVLQHGGWYLMFYIGYWDEDTAQIGIARSRNGIAGWERHPCNPVIGPSEHGWDGDATYKPFAIFDGQRWRLWYNGRLGNMEQIGLAEHDGEDLGF